MKAPLLIFLWAVIALSNQTLWAQDGPQDCAELFISEYADGLGNNKYLEIFNPTENSIDLSDYAVTRFRNGAALNSSGECADCWVTPLQGSIAGGDVFVIMNGQNEDVPLGGGGTSPAVSPHLRNYAQMFDCIQPYMPGQTPSPADECYGGAQGNLTGSFSYMNGDDAIALLKKRGGGETGGLFMTNVTGSTSPDGNTVATAHNWTIIDLIGEIGFQPSTGWGFIPGDDCSYGSTPGGLAAARYATRRNTLVRKAEVKQGVRTNPNGRCALGGSGAGFNASAEWDTVGYQYHMTLGWHVVDAPCYTVTPASRQALNATDVSFYPNPVAVGRTFTLSTVQHPIQRVQIRDIQGRVVKTEIYTDRALRRELQTEGLRQGIYLLDVHSEHGGSITKKLVIQ